MRTRGYEMSLLGGGVAIGALAAAGMVGYFSAAERTALKEGIGQSLYEQYYDDCLREAESGETYLDVQAKSPDYLGLGNTVEFDAQEQGGGVLSFTVEQVNDEYVLLASRNAAIILTSVGCTPPASTK